jgi:REP element-mobilizing transposase RayT
MNYFSGDKIIQYITITVQDWVDIFTRPDYRHIIVSSLQHCINEKGLEVFAWVLMSNHLHLIVSAKEGIHLSDIIRDFKKFTSKKIISTIEDIPESRRKWLLDRFEFAGRTNSKIKYFTVWQEGYHPKEIFSEDFLREKINYIHQNPVRAELVAEAHHYTYSSAIDYAGGKGLITVILI